MNNAITSGPWVREIQADGWYEIVPAGGNEQNVAVAKEIRPADAALIAQCPRLLQFALRHRDDPEAAEILDDLRAAGAIDA